MPCFMLIAKTTSRESSSCWILVTLQRERKEWILQLNECDKWNVIAKYILFYGNLKFDANASNIKNK